MTKKTLRQVQSEAVDRLEDEAEALRAENARLQSLFVVGDDPSLVANTFFQPLTEKRVQCVGCQNAGVTMLIPLDDVQRCGCGAVLCFDCMDQIGHCSGDQCDRNADREER